MGLRRGIERVGASRLELVRRARGKGARSATADCPPAWHATPLGTLAMRLLRGKVVKMVKMVTLCAPPCLGILKFERVRLGSGLGARDGRVGCMRGLLLPDWGQGGEIVEIGGERRLWRELSGVDLPVLLGALEPGLEDAPTPELGCQSGAATRRRSISRRTSPDA